MSSTNMKRCLALDEQIHIGVSTVPNKVGCFNSPEEIAEVEMELDDEVVTDSCVQISSNGHGHKDAVSSEATTYAEASKSWLSGLNWKTYPPCLTSRKAFADDDDLNDTFDPASSLLPLYPDSTPPANSNTVRGETYTADSADLHHNFDHREFIFTMLQKFASTNRSFIGPLTLQSANILARLSADLIDDALSNDDNRIQGALHRLFGDFHTGEKLLGELSDERRWDVAEEIAEDCVAAVISQTAQEADFYSKIRPFVSLDPVYSMIQAETDWLLYEMVSFISDEHADMFSYDRHFYGPTEEDKKKELLLAQQKEAQLEHQRQQQQQQQQAVAQTIEAYPGMLSSIMPEQNYSYPYMIPEVPIDPNATEAEYWQNYYDIQQQSAYVQAAAYSYSVKQRAQYALASLAQTNSPQQQQPHQQQHQPGPQVQSAGQSSNSSNNRNTSLAVKYLKSALKTKVGEKSATSNAQQTSSSCQNTTKDTTDRHSKEIPRASKMKERSSKRDDDDDRQCGPFYCMVTNLRNDVRSSDVERATQKVGRIDSIKVLRDKAARPPENSLAAITFRYVYKSPFEKLLSKGLHFDGKYHPTAKLQSDPLGSSAD